MMDCTATVGNNLIIVSIIVVILTLRCCCYIPLNLDRRIPSIQQQAPVAIVFVRAASSSLAGL